MLKDVEYEWTCMVPVCGKENPPAPNGMVRPATPPATLPDGGPPPGSPAPCNVASSVCASTREIEGRSFNVAPSPSVCASVQVQEKIL